MAHDEREILGQLASGSRVAFRAVYDEHVRATYAAALRVTNQYEDAEEATQDAFVQLVALKGDVVKVRNVRGWLMQVASRRAIDLIRRRRETTTAHGNESHHQGTEDGGASVVTLESLMPPVESPRGSIERADLVGRIHTLLDHLPARQAQAFRLRHYQGMSMNEVAAAMGCTAGAVKAHIHLATARLRKLLEAENALGRSPAARKEQAP